MTLKNTLNKKNSNESNNYNNNNIYNYKEYDNPNCGNRQEYTYKHNLYESEANINSENKNNNSYEKNYNRNSYKKTTDFEYERKYNEEEDSLEGQLNQLLKEKKYLEDCLLKLPENPRTLKDIKLKNSIKDKITQGDKEIFNIQKQLKNIRGQ